MIEKDLAKKQVMRLGQMLGFPRDNAEALRELVSAVQVANTRAMAEAAITNVLDTATTDIRCPMPAEIRRWINERQESEDTAQKRRTRECRVCSGTGVEIVERNGLSGARECACRKSVTGVAQ